MLWHIRTSVCPSHSDIVSKQGNAEGCCLHHRVAQCLRVFRYQEWLMADDCPSKLSVQRGLPHCKNSRSVHILPQNSGTVTDSEKSSINTNRKSTMSFPTNHQPISRMSPLTSPKWVQIPKFVGFYRNLDQKTLKVWHKKIKLKLPVAKLWSHQLPIKRYQLFGRACPVPVKFGPNGKPKDARCTHMAVSNSRPSCWLYIWPLTSFCITTHNISNSIQTIIV